MTLTGRIKFNNVDLGDHGKITTSFDGNPNVVIIPRAKGVRIRSTEEMGGGQLNIVVTGAISRATRIEVESYFINLETTLDYTKSGTLTVTSEGTLLELENCYLQSLTQDDSDTKLARFTATFIKSI